MGIFASSSCLTGFANVIDLVNHYCQAGIKHIELGSGNIPGPGFREQLSVCACNYLIHNYFPPPQEPFVLNLASDDPSIQQRSLNLVKQAIELSAELGAPFYSVHAGFITDPYDFRNQHFLFSTPKCPDAYQNAFDRFVSTLLLANEHARNYKVELLVENNVCWPDLRGKLLLQTTDEFLQLFSILNDNNIGILLDFGHLNVSSRTLKFDRLSFATQLASHIRAFHVHDNNGLADTHQPIQPDSWILDVLRRREFEGLPAVIEAKFGNITDLCQHIDWLKVEWEH